MCLTTDKMRLRYLPSFQMEMKELQQQLIKKQVKKLKGNGKFTETGSLS